MAAKQQSSHDTAASLQAISGFVGAKQGDEFHRLLNDRVRLGMMSSLMVSNPMTFSELKRLLETSDGNLSVHARKLESAGYITCTKYFEGRSPRTEYAITATGRRVLKRYLKHMEALIKATAG